MKSVDEIEFAPLSEVPEAELIALMNHPAVGRHLPLLAGGFTPADRLVFLEQKARLWAEHGFGPWAFRIKGRFAGWGGLQPEQGEADFALVLHPDFWGWGRRIFLKARDQAFGELGLDSITVLLPPGRRNRNAVLRLGFAPDGAAAIGEERFERFRLTRPGDEAACEEGG